MQTMDLQDTAGQQGCTPAAQWQVCVPASALSRAPRRLSLAARCLLSLLLSLSCLSISAQLSDGSYAVVEEDVTDTERSIEIATAMWQAGQIQKAEELYLQAFTTAKQPYDRLKAARSISEFYRSEGRANKAADIYESMLDDDELANDPACLKVIYQELGRTYNSDAKYIKAMRNYRAAMVAASREKLDSVFLTTIYTDMAKTLMVAGDVQYAESLIDSAQMFSGSAGIVVLSEVVSTKARILALMGRYEEAYNGMEQTVSLNLKQWNNQVSTLMNSTNPIFMQQKIEARNRYERHIQELNAKIDEVEEARRKAYGATIGIGLFALVSITGFIVALGRMRDTDKEKRQIEQKNRDNEKVISIIAHDAMTQFNTLLGFASILLENNQPKGGEEAEFSKLIYTSAQKLYEMMSNLLAWSRTKRQMKPKKQLVLVNDAISRVVGVCQIMATSKDIEITNRIESDVTAVVDPNHLEIVIRNLLSNAIKFTNKGGVISLSALMHGDRTSLIVEDNGVGMDEEIVASFNNDETLTSTEGTEHEKGNGFGLSICRDLVRANGGNIIINSARGKGTSASIVLRKT